MILRSERFDIIFNDGSKHSPDAILDRVIQSITEEKDRIINVQFIDLGRTFEFWVYVERSLT